MWLSWDARLGWTLKWVRLVFLWKGKIWTQMHTGRTPCAGEGRDPGHVLQGRDRQRCSASPQEPQRRGADPWQPSERPGPGDTLTLDCWPPESWDNQFLHVCHLSHSVRGPSWWQPQEADPNPDCHSPFRRGERTGLWVREIKQSK